VPFVALEVGGIRDMMETTDELLYQNVSHLGNVR